MNDFIQIVKGEDKVIKISLVNSDGSPFDLAGYTAITGSFQNADKTVLVKTATVISSDAGKIQLSLSDTETALLKEANRQAFYVTVDKGAARTVVIKGFETAISVVAKPF